MVGLDIYDDYGGELDARRFKHLLPLPDGNLVVSHAKDNGPPKHLELRGENFEELAAYSYGCVVNGLAFDGDTETVYVATEAGLYAYDSSLSEIWNTTATFPGFAGNNPVIADDGGILGCLGGVLRRVEPDGSPGPEQDCGAYLRPCVLNGGTIAVITESTINYFDEGLNEVGEIPLPSGADTGSQYTKPPLVDTDDNMALFAGSDLYIIDKDGNVITKRTFDDDIREIRLGPEHLFVALDYEIFRFSH